MGKGGSKAGLGGHKRPEWQNRLIISCKCERQRNYQSRLLMLHWLSAFHSYIGLRYAGYIHVLNKLIRLHSIKCVGVGQMGKI